MSDKEFKKYVDEMHKNILYLLKDNDEELAFYVELISRFNTICENNLRKEKDINKAISFLENQYYTFPTAEEWKNALKDILKGGYNGD